MQVEVLTVHRGGPSAPTGLMVHVKCPHNPVDDLIGFPDIIMLIARTRGTFDLRLKILQKAFRTDTGHVPDEAASIVQLPKPTP